eukprot:CAMPEP_0173217804 /NCGR_PEP_ID=MMETSP1142-20121109/703_1 /TAXON_ID=483371 /ORGANISM="non described non described, Strain CCMP2298" /LENGTH=242 /DNA_ID=CAMNT_0014145433 /DNA_START=348 /DNA_END=1077 /DNA_ORIENTATION=-
MTLGITSTGLFQAHTGKLQRPLYTRTTTAGVLRQDRASSSGQLGVRSQSRSERIAALPNCYGGGEVLGVLTDEKSALICPFYPLTVDVLPPGKCAVSTVLNVASSTLASIKAFSNIGMCHGDIKPSNLMLTTDSQHVVLIDFGSAVTFGKTLVSTSSPWGRDCDITGSTQYDLTCLASVIYYLWHGNHLLSITDLLDADDTSLHILDLDTMKADWAEKVNIATVETPELVLVDLAAIWPTNK